MAKKAKYSKEVSALLRRLEMVSNRDVSVTFEGHALSRSETDIHLAIQSGIIAVPIEAIIAVSPLSDAHGPDWVRIKVKDPRLVIPLQAPGHADLIKRGTEVARAIKNQTFCCDYSDTVCYPDGYPQTDDAICDHVIDDHDV